MTYLGLLTNAIVCYDENEPEKIIIKRYETAIKMWKLIFEDENYLFYHGQLDHLRKMTAVTYAKLGNREKVYENLRKAMFHEKEHDALPLEKVNYTGTFIKSVSYDPAKTTKNYTESNAVLFKKMYYRIRHLSRTVKIRNSNRLLLIELHRHLKLMLITIFLTNLLQ